VCLEAIIIPSDYGEMKPAFTESRSSASDPKPSAAITIGSVLPYAAFHNPPP
jgi:hypothetical protein